MQFFDAVEAMRKDPSKKFTRDVLVIIRWIDGQVLQSKGRPECFVLGSLTVKDQCSDWTLVEEPKQEYTFAQLIGELYRLGSTYYGKCTDGTQSTSDIRVKNNFIKDGFENLWVRFITDPSLRFHIYKDGE